MLMKENLLKLSNECLLFFKFSMRAGRRKSKTGKVATGDSFLPGSLLQLTTSAVARAKVKGVDNTWRVE